MKAISLWQPWATLIAIGAKKIETRGWYTGYRGPLAVHAAKKWGDEFAVLCAKEPFRAALDAVGFVSTRRASETRLPFGAIVATCDLVDCLPTYERPEPIVGNRIVGTPEASFGDYRDGRFGWILGDVRALPEPIPFRGAQGFFDVPDDLLNVPPPAAVPDLFTGLTPEPVTT